MDYSRWKSNTQNVYSKWSDEWSANKTMIKIADIKELKLNITWKLLYRGLLEKQISINEIIEYAKETTGKKEMIELKYVSWQVLVTMI